MLCRLIQIGSKSCHFVTTFFTQRNPSVLKGQNVFLYPIAWNSRLPWSTMEDITMVYPENTNDRVYSKSIMIPNCRRWSRLGPMWALTYMLMTGSMRIVPVRATQGADMMHSCLGSVCGSPHLVTLNPQWSGGSEGHGVLVEKPDTPCLSD